MLCELIARSGISLPVRATGDAGLALIDELSPSSR